MEIERSNRKLKKYTYNFVQFWIACKNRLLLKVLLFVPIRFIFAMPFLTKKEEENLW
jgi:hypothetical protein